MAPVVDDGPTIMRKDTWAGAGGTARKYVRAVRDLAENRFDVDALAWGTPITVWTAEDRFGSEIVAFEVDGMFATRIDDDGAQRWVFDDGSTLDGPTLTRPVPYQVITSKIGLREHPLNRKRVRFHAGTDYAAPIGTPVRAIADGVAVKVTRSWTAGRYVTIRHDDGHESKYMHFDKHAPGLVEGQRVRQGEVIGFVGKTGRVTGPHLHFEVRDRHRTPIDPVATSWPASNVVDEALVRKLHLRRDLLRTIRSDGTRDVMNPLVVARDGCEQDRSSKENARTVLPPVAPVRAAAMRSRLTPPPLRRRRPIPTTRPLFDDDPRRSTDPFIQRAALLATDFPDDPRFV